MTDSFIDRIHNAARPSRYPSAELVENWMNALRDTDNMTSVTFAGQGLAELASDVITRYLYRLSKPPVGEESAAEIKQLTDLMYKLNPPWKGQGR